MSKESKREKISDFFEYEEVIMTVLVCPVCNIQFGISVHYGASFIHCCQVCHRSYEETIFGFLAEINF